MSNTCSTDDGGAERTVETSSRTPGRRSLPATSSFPHPGQDYFEGSISLDRHLIRRPASTFVLRVESDALRSMGIAQGDEIIVDRSIEPRPGRVLVVVADGPSGPERRIGRFEVHPDPREAAPGEASGGHGRAWLVTDAEEIPLTADVEPWGVATVVCHHLPLGPGW